MAHPRLFVLTVETDWLRRTFCPNPSGCATQSVPRPTGPISTVTRRRLVCENASIMSSGWPVALLALVALAGVFSYQRSRQSADLAKLRAVQDQLEERTVELERAIQDLNRLTGIDPLTLVSNHSGLQEFLRKEWRRPLRDATAVSVLMVDIDNFSDYNDSLGHQTGERCLAKVGEAIKTAACRPGDPVVRYGGEEFGIVLTRTDNDGASKVVQKIKAAVEALWLEHPASPMAKHVIASIKLAAGTAAVDSNREELEFITAATRALTKAKQSGRNMIVSAADSSA